MAVAQCIRTWFILPCKIHDPSVLLVPFAVQKVDGSTACPPPPRSLIRDPSGSKNHRRFWNCENVKFFSGGPSTLKRDMTHRTKFYDSPGSVFFRPPPRRGGFYPQTLLKIPSEIHVLWFVGEGLHRKPLQECCDFTGAALVGLNRCL